jgi:hypothetical protein
MKHFLSMTFFCAICFALHGCHEDDKKQNLSFQSRKSAMNYNRKNFDSLLTVIVNRKPAQADINEELLNDPAFLEIYTHSLSYFGDVKNMLKRKPIAPSQISICTFAMQNLNVSDYVNLCNIYLDLYCQHKISEKILEEIISPNFLNKRILASNYSNQSVIHLLSTIKKKDISREFKDLIDSILSGQ